MFEYFNQGSIFDKAVFCLAEKQGMLANDECSSWYNSKEIFKCQFEIGERKSYMAMDYLTRSVETTLLYSSPAEPFLMIRSGFARLIP